MSTAEDLIPALDLDNIEHIEWLKIHNNPADNFEVVSAEMCFRNDPHQFIDWLIDQPDLDRGTAGFIFFGAGGLERVMGSQHYGRVDPEWADRLLYALCARSEQRGFQFDRIAPPSWCNDSRDKLLDFLSNNAPSADFLIPYNLFNAPFPAEGMASHYSEIGEGELVTDSYLSETLPDIYGPEGTIHSYNSQQKAQKKRGFFGWFR